MVPRQDLRNTTVADTQLAGNVTGSNTKARQFDDLHAGLVGQWPSVDEEAAQLVHLAVLLRLRFCNDGERGKCGS